MDYCGASSSYSRSVPLRNHEKITVVGSFNAILPRLSRSGTWEWEMNKDIFTRPSNPTWYFGTEKCSFICQLFKRYTIKFSFRMWISVHFPIRTNHKVVINHQILFLQIYTCAITFVIMCILCTMCGHMNGGRTYLFIFMPCVN